MELMAFSPWFLSLVVNLIFFLILFLFLFLLLSFLTFTHSIFNVF